MLDLLYLGVLVVFVRGYGLKLLSGCFKGSYLYFLDVLTMTTKASRPFGAPATICPKTQRYFLEHVNQNVAHLRNGLT